MKKLGLALIVVCSISSLYSMEHNSLAEMREVKKAFTRAALRCAPRWAFDRTAGVVVGAGLCAMQGIFLFACMLNQGSTRPPEAACAVNLLSMVATVPTELTLLVRQPFLISRDLKLLYSYTKSSTLVNLENFPTVEELDQVNNYNQLLSRVADDIHKEGNILEKLTVLTPGFRGYDYVDASKKLE